MSVVTVRKDLKNLADPIMSDLGFKVTGDLDEYVRVTSDGDRHGVLLDVMQQSSSYVLSLGTFIYYSEIESCVGIRQSSDSYTINIYQDAVSIPKLGYEAKQLTPVLSQLIDSKSEPFFKKYGYSQAAIDNFASNNYNEWFTSDKVSQYKIRFASAIHSQDKNAILEISEEARKYCCKPWSLTYRSEIEEMLESVKKYI